jgi:hypothetical protein
MTGRKKAAEAASSEVRNEKAPQEALPARNELTDKQLAKAVLARLVRPRVGEVRRLAEAVLKKDVAKAGKKKGKAGKAKSAKLVRIPRARK